MHEHEELFNEYEYLIKISLHKLFKHPHKVAQANHLQYDDLLQYARLGLFDACKTYESKKIGSFRNYAIRNIKWSITRNLSKEKLNLSIYKDEYYKGKQENRRFTLLSMHNKPHADNDDDTSFYDVISCDGINSFRSDDVLEGKVISSITTKNILNLISTLKKSDQELVMLRANDMSYQEISDYYGNKVTRQAIQAKLKRIKLKLNQYREVI